MGSRNYGGELILLTSTFGGLSTILHTKEDLNFRRFSILLCHGVEKNRFTTHSNGLEGLQQSHG